MSKLYAFALAAVFALTLAGCGGGGGGTAQTPDPPDPPPMPTPQEMCEADGGRYNTDGSCTSAADLAQEMIDAAQMAAATAAMAANDALNAAKAAFGEISGLEGYDELHYNLAAGALDDARRAKQAADAANQAAMDADTPAAAEAAQADAEQAQADAEAAQALAAGFVQAVKDAKMAADQREEERLAEEERQRIARENAMKISDAQEAARLASVAASEAAMAAATALAMLQADADATAHQLVTATTAKIAADAAAQDAADAYAAAMSADTVGAAESARDDAQMAQSVAEAQQGIIDGFNTANEGNRETDEAERQRMADVNAAREAAMGSVTAANKAAEDADAAATRVEEIAADTPAATAAREAADAAQEAANAAQAALNAIMDNMTKEQADAQAVEAAKQAMYANNNYMTASGIKDTTETNLGIAQEENRKRDVAAATTAANNAANEAKKAADDAAAAATAAETARDNAKKALDRAMAARTDTTEAQKQYEAAKAAAMLARTAAGNAMQAYTDAKMAAEGIDPAGSAADAQTAQGTAETEQDNAEDELGTAKTQQGLAKTAEEAAVAAEGTHTLGLFKMANAVGVMDNPATDANEQANAIKAVADEIGDAAGSTSDADNNSLTDTGGSTVSATATWNANTPADPDATPPTEEVVMPLTVTITGVGTGFTSDTKGTDANEDGDFDDTGDTAPNAKSITGLPGFQYGFDITDDNRHVLVFTDKKQATLLVPAKTTTVANLPVQMSRIKARPTSETNSTPITVTGVLADLGAQVLYDHDGNPDTLAIEGTFSCQGNDCVLQVIDGKLSTIEGDIRFSTATAQTIVAEKAANPMADYLVFGVWLNEDGNNDDTVDDPGFGAFANGGATFATPVALTGSATYNGAATGVYTDGSSVDYFQGAVELTANFGAPGTETDPNAVDDELGNISGVIYNIVAGGVSMDDIRLSQTAITAAGEFTGNARMGAAMVQPDDSVKYPYNGHWGGQFYGPAAAADAEGVDTLPPAAAGTFGVTGTDKMGTDDTEDDVTRSFVGAFGARR